MSTVATCECACGGMTEGRGLSKIDIELPEGGQVGHRWFRMERFLNKYGDFDQDNCDQFHWINGRPNGELKSGPAHYE